MSAPIEPDKICQEHPVTLRFGQLLPQDVGTVTVVQSDSPEDVAGKLADLLEETARQIRAEAGL